MLDPKFANDFAQDWIQAWNRHDLDQVLSHYTEDFEMSSPYIRQIAGDPAGVLRGKVPVRAYWAKALTLMPDLNFELLTVLLGVNTITLHYRGGGGKLAAEVFHFGADRKVQRAFAHYAV